MAAELMLQHVSMCIYPLFADVSCAGQLLQGTDIWEAVVSGIADVATELHSSADAEMTCDLTSVEEVMLRL